jgi:hypothetical protein
MLNDIFKKIAMILSVVALTTALAWAGDDKYDDKYDKSGYSCPKYFPASSQHKCEKAGGVFYQDDSVKKCVVSEKSYPVQCDRPAGNQFEAEVARTKVFIKTDYGYGKEKCSVKKDKEIVACINPQGKSGKGVYIGTPACDNKGCFKKDDGYVSKFRY